MLCSGSGVLFADVYTRCVEQSTRKMSTCLKNLKRYTFFSYYLVERHQRRSIFRELSLGIIMRRLFGGDLLIVIIVTKGLCGGHRIFFIYMVTGG